ncbi:unnamed protein product [Polarella glacialis]|uniref:SAM domain-containing protein n=1 Tax=Polarella glacialis TaxID=89957 RepID=A0A813J1I0_POLGL|nr:unnamed protein product [Polarella glacialis]CAE8669843.1 unnamed protein product [Polarella glacialis]CAE8725817.1 unnamed protein product [Polarella glacialis]
MRQMPLLRANPDLAGYLCSAMYSNQSSVQQVLPARLDMLSTQVQQVCCVLVPRFAEVMEEGVLHAEEAKHILRTITGQLFESAEVNESILQSFKEEVNNLKQHFKAQHGGLRQCIQEKQDPIRRKTMTAKAFNLIYGPVASVFHRGAVDYVVVFTALSASILMFPGRVAIKGLCVGIIGCAAVTKVQLFGECTDFQAAQVDLAAQSDNADQVVNFCNGMESLLAEVEKDFSAVELHRSQILNQANQIDLLLRNLDARRWNAERLSKFLKERDMGHCVEAFLTKVVSGKVFLDILDQQLLQDKLGIQDQLSQKCLLQLKGDLKDTDRFMEPSPVVSGLVRSIQQSMQQLERDVNSIKRKLQRNFLPP